MSHNGVAHVGRTDAGLPNGLANSGYGHMKGPGPLHHVTRNGRIVVTKTGPEIWAWLVRNDRKVSHLASVIEAAREHEMAWPLPKTKKRKRT